MNHRAASFTNTDWDDPTGQSQAMAVRWMWDQRYLKCDLEERAARNYAFYEGKQLHEWSNFHRQMKLPTHLRNLHDPNLQDYLIANVIKPLLIQKHSKFSRNEPIWNVPAFTRDEYDQTVARFSNDLMAWYAIHGLKIPEINDALIRHMFCSPITFVEAFWDSTKGEDLPPVTLDDFFSPQQEIPEFVDPQQADAIIAENDALRKREAQQFTQLRGFNPQDGKVYQKAGDISLAIRTIFETMWYPFVAKSRDEVKAYLVSTVMVPEEVSHRYGIPIDEVIREASSADVGEHRLKMIGAYGSPYMGQTPVHADYDNGVMVHQLHVSKDVVKPHGATVVCIGDSKRAIRWGKLGNALGRLPMQDIVEHPSPNTLWGTCSVDDAITAQVEINDALTKARKLRRKRVNSKLCRKKQDGSDLRSLKSDSPIYEVDSLEDIPRFIQQPIDSIEEHEVVDFWTRFLQDAIGIPDVALGRNEESDAQSGRAILALQSGANERLQTTGKALNRLWSKVGTQVLADLQKYASAQRVTGIVGDNNSVQFEIWSSARLRPSMYDQFPNQVANVNVDTFSAIPQSPAEQQAMVLNLLKLNAIPPEDIPRVVSDVFGLQDIRQVLDRGRAGRDRAANNIERWKRGAQVDPPIPEQDHESFVRVYEDWINTDEFAAINEKQPMIGAMVRRHVEEHKAMMSYNDARDVMRVEMSKMRAARDWAKEALNQGMIGAAGLFHQLSLGAAMGQGPDKPKPDQTNQEKQDAADVTQRNAAKESDARGGNANPAAAPTGTSAPSPATAPAAA